MQRLKWGLIFGSAAFLIGCALLAIIFVGIAIGTWAFGILVGAGMDRDNASVVLCILGFLTITGFLVGVFSED